MSVYSSFYVKPTEFEHIETVVHIKSDPRPAILGIVKTTSGVPVSDAVVALFEAGTDGSAEKPIDCLFTDREGQFLFGPLSPSKLYAVKVYKSSYNPRFLDYGKKPDQDG